MQNVHDKQNYKAFGLEGCINKCKLFMIYCKEHMAKLSISFEKYISGKVE
jgi:hypothetical protein